MSVQPIGLTGSLRGAPFHQPREPNFSKLIASFVNIGYPPGSLRRKYCIEYFVKGASFALTLSGTILTIDFIGKSLLHHPQECALTAFSFIALITLIKVGQKIALHYQSWKENELRLREDNACFLEKGSVQKYAATHLGKMFVQASYVVGALFTLSLIGSLFDYPNKLVTGLFVTFYIFVVVLWLGVLCSGYEALRGPIRQDLPDIEKAASEPPLRSLSSASLQPIPSKMLVSPQGLPEREPRGQLN